MFKIIVLLIMTYLLNCVDYMQTTYMIRQFGLCVELNPIARLLFEYDLAWTFKIIVSAIAYTAIGIIVAIERKLSWTVYLLATLYFLVVAHNFAMLAKVDIF